MIENTPSKKLTAALQQYGEELEAIKQSLESAMSLFKMMKSDRIKKHEEFVREYCEDLKESAASKTFLVPANKITEYRRIERSIINLNSSQHLMPRNLIVAMVCTYDAFLGKVIRFILETMPEILNSSERNISFSDLKKFDSISDAREYIMEKEIETVLRKSHIEHFDWLELKLKTPFKKGLESWPTFVELTQRRNLFVHSDGIVSSQYLTVCNEHKCPLGEATKNGAKLGVSKHYFDECFCCLYEIGIKLSHVVWRKLLLNELKSIDENLIGVTFDLIDKRDYLVAIRILEFFTDKSIKHSDDAQLRIMLINLAQSYKWNKQNDKCIELLCAHDWSSSQDQFKLAVSVLKEDWDSTYSIMKRICHDDEFDRAAFRNWPLFKELRKQERFPEIYELCYNEPFSSLQAIFPPRQENSEIDQDASTNERSSVDEA